MRPDYCLRAFGLVLAIFVLAGSGALADDDPLKAEIQLRYAAMKAAMTAHDGVGIAAILAPDFISVDIAGTSEGASQMIAEVNALKPDPDKSSETTLISVTRMANAATVKQKYDMKTIRVGIDGSRHQLELISLSTDVWIKPANDWLIERTVTDNATILLDGKLVSHKP